MGTQRGGDDLWTSGKVASRATAHIRYAGPPVRSTQRAWWSVRVWDGADQPSPWTPPAYWEMGLLDDAEWNATWIRGRRRGPERAPHVLRRTFDTTGPIRRARLYATALGVYDAAVNGAGVAADRFAPGWTDYNTRLAYQTYDVTALVVEGENTLTITVADGWYCGWVGFLKQRDHYGTEPAVFAQLVVEAADGEQIVVATDESWDAGTGPITATDMLMGEHYDARVAPGGWEPVVLAADVTPGALVPTLTPLPTAVEELSPIAITEPSAGAFVFDLGQNIVGWARLTVRGAAAGDAVTLRFGEMLDATGALYTENLRSAEATDRFVSAGASEEVFEPRFTFHGFRYIEVTGYPGRPALDTVVGVVCHSPVPITGRFACSDELLTQLQSNIVWGQRGNFLEVPTDCPQRDERLGWMGDAQVFARTAAFNADVASFFTKWMDDVVDAQSEEGGFPDVAPRIVDEADGAPGWGDAGVIVPWVLYGHYADTALIDKHFDAMARWVDYIDAANPDHVWRSRRNNDMGDWLSIDADSPKDVVATSFFAHSAALVARMAKAIGRAEIAGRYEELAAAIRRAYADAFVRPDGRIEGDTQTVYALAIRFDLLPETLRDEAGGHLVADIEGRGNHLSTGFLGVAHLLPALTEIGAVDTAYALLQQESYPSWLYAVRHGATTIWERWDGWTEDRGFQDPEMNSFNHYAFGAVGEWLYETVAGLRADPDRPGFEHFFVAPQPGGTLTWAELQYESLRGTIRTRWDLDGNRFRLAVSVPPNASATVSPPGLGEDVTVGAGEHVFTSELPA